MNDYIIIRTTQEEFDALRDLLSVDGTTIDQLDQDQIICLEALSKQLENGTAVLEAWVMETSDSQFRDSILDKIVSLSPRGQINMIEAVKNQLYENIIKEADELKAQSISYLEAAKKIKPKAAPKPEKEDTPNTQNTHKKKKS